MTAGVFAKRTRLSDKALRLYNDIGLLEPVFVNEANRYRYYSPTQVEKAKLISLLRQLEMPLTTIADVLDLKGAALTQAIARYWQTVEQDVHAKRKLVHYLKTYLEEKGEVMFDVLVRDIPEQKLLTVERRVHIGDLKRFVKTSSKMLNEHIAESKQRVAGDRLTIYHGLVNEDSDGPVENCVPFEGSLEPKGRMRIRLEPAHKEAYVRITKAQWAFPDILAAYDAVEDYLVKAGLKFFSPREVYFSDGKNIDNNEPVCDVAFPFVR